MKAQVCFLLQDGRRGVPARMLSPPFDSNHLFVFVRNYPMLAPPAEKPTYTCLVPQACQCRRVAVCSEAESQFPSATEPRTTSPVAYCVNPSTSNCAATESLSGEMNCGRKTNIKKVLGLVRC